MYGFCLSSPDVTQLQCQICPSLLQQALEVTYVLNTVTRTEYRTMYICVNITYILTYMYAIPTMQKSLRRPVYSERIFPTSVGNFAVRNPYLIPTYMYIRMYTYVYTYILYTHLSYVLYTFIYVHMYPYVHRYILYMHIHISHTYK